MNDSFGALIVIIRDNPDVAALVAGRVSSEIEALLPCVQLIGNTEVREPFGPGSGRMEMLFWSGIARCYAADSPTGAIAARQLAGAVSDAIHNHRPVKVGTRYIARAYAPSIDGPNRDPVTRYPYYDVTVNAYPAAQAVA